MMKQDFEWSVRIDGNLSTKLILSCEHVKMCNKKKNHIIKMGDMMIDTLKVR